MEKFTKIHWENTTESVQIRPKKRRADPAQWASECGGSYPPLELVTKPNLTTAELAYYSNMCEQTWRVKACYDSAPEGLRPLRVCGKLAWPTAGVKKLLGIAPLQNGFVSLACLVFLALLALFVWATWPGIFGALDWAGFTALGAGVISNRFRPTDSQFDLNDFIEAATYRGEIGGVIVRERKPICTLQRDGQTIELTAKETAKYVSDYEFMAHQDQLYVNFLYSQHPDEVANAPTITEHFSGKSERRAQANVATSIHQGRPTMGTLNDVLKDTADHKPDGFTKITGATASRRSDLQEERDTIHLEVAGVTACLDIQDDVSVFIRRGVTVEHARKILKAIFKKIKAFSSLEPYTPTVPTDDDDSLPF